MDTPVPRAALIGALLVSATLRAQTPWATNVVEYVQGDAPVDGYTLPDVTLGRPTVMTYADLTETTPSVVVVPVYPPWEFDQIVSIGEGGHLILQLGEPVVNDPRNPYGVDLLVFGNALLTGGGLYDQHQNDPRSYTLSDSPALTDKWGVVSVSEDGQTWYDFPPEQRVGRLMPTLGKIWTGTEWGADTDPTLPPDPSLTLSDLANMNLADLCIRYRGGAGGTGFDLHDLVVPPGQTPPAEFHYVKISVPDDGEDTTNRRTEIDAVTVVSPVDGFTRWQQENFAWTRDPADEAPSANPDSDDYDNWAEYGLGGDPSEPETDLPPPVISVKDSGLSLELPASAAEAPWRVWAATEPGAPDAWQRVTPQPSHVDTPEGDRVHRAYTLPDAEPGVRLYRLQLENPP